MYLLGASGHGKVIAEIASLNHLDINAFIDDNQSIQKLMNYDVLHQLPSPNIEMVISVGNNAIRKKIAEKYNQVTYLTLIHPNSNISTSANIEKGTVVMAGVSVNADVVIGKHCILNTNASIDHDCQIEDFVHISPNAALAGNVQVGEGTHIGMGAAVIQGIKIGKWCQIGAGAVIISDVPDGATVVGNPGKIIKINSGL